MRDGVVERIRAAGGEIYAITSEPQHLADQAHEHWALDFENVGDPHQEISRTCSERGWLTLYASAGKLEFLQRGTDWDVEHPKGFFQPGVLSLTSTGRVLYRWRSVPSDENLQGAFRRPTPEHAWNAIESSLAAGEAAGDAEHDEDPVLDHDPPPRAIFIASVIANGWFVGVKSFAYSPGVNSASSRFGFVGYRWLLFLAFWATALALLPKIPVGLALAGWIFWIARDIRRVLNAMDIHEELIANH